MALNTDNEIAYKRIYVNYLKKRGEYNEINSLTHHFAQSSQFSSSMCFLILLIFFIFVGGRQKDSDIMKQLRWALE